MNADKKLTCNECGAALDQLYPNNKNNISVPLKVSNPKNGDTLYANLNFCDEDCLANHLNHRAEAKAALINVNVVSPLGKVEIDFTSK